MNLFDFNKSIYNYYKLTKFTTRVLTILNEYIVKILQSDLKKGKKFSKFGTPEVLNY